MKLDGIGNVSDLWRLAPKWANWVAQDKDGTIVFFTQKPYVPIGESYWIQGERLPYEILKGGTPHDNWKQSLMKRPEEMSYVVITENPVGFWYEGLIGSCFSVLPAGSDWRECEGMGPYEQSDCLEVSKGEYKGNIILKKHCVVVTPKNPDDFQDTALADAIRKSDWKAVRDMFESLKRENEWLRNRFTRVKGGLSESIRMIMSVYEGLD